MSGVLDGLQAQLCPLYCSLLATKSGKWVSKGPTHYAAPEKVLMPGPVAQLPVKSQVSHTQIAADCDGGMHGGAMASPTMWPCSAFVVIHSRHGSTYVPSNQFYRPWDLTPRAIAFFVAPRT